MKVDTVFRRMIVRAQPGERLADVAAMMAAFDVGAIAIFDRRRCVGIITERDLVRAMAEGADPQSARVWRYMTPDPATASPEDDVGAAAAMMLQLHARHLPVVDGGSIVGMLSIRDVTRGLRDAALIPKPGR